MELAPTAYFKMWWDDGRPRCRVDMTDICEPWLDALKPTITPLYPADKLEALSRENAELREALSDIRQMIDDHRHCFSKLAPRAKPPRIFVESLMGCVEGILARAALAQTQSEG